MKLTQNTVISWKPKANKSHGETNGSYNYSPSKGVNAFEEVNDRFLRSFIQDNHNSLINSSATSYNFFQKRRGTSTAQQSYYPGCTNSQSIAAKTAASVQNFLKTDKYTRVARSSNVSFKVQNTIKFEKQNTKYDPRDQGLSSYDLINLDRDK